MLVVITRQAFAISYNQLLDEDSLADTGTTEETNLTTTGVWGEKVDNLDTGNENLGRGGLLSENWWVGVNWGVVLGLDWTTLVDWVTSNVHDTTKSTLTDWNSDWSARVGGGLATAKTLGTCTASVSPILRPGYSTHTVHGNATNDIFTQMLLKGVSIWRYAIESMGVVRTATSRTSLLPWFWVVRALRIGGSCSVSNLTIHCISCCSFYPYRCAQ